MVSRVLPLPAARAFALVAAVGEHGRWIPLTRVEAPQGELQVGDDVVARTAGVLVDRMRVSAVAPPRRLVLRKLGPVLLGTATITVEHIDHVRSRVTWGYDVHLGGPLPPAVTGPALGRLLGVMAALALWRIARWVDRTRPT